MSLKKILIENTENENSLPKLNDYYFSSDLDQEKMKEDFTSTFKKTEFPPFLDMNKLFEDAYHSFFVLERGGEFETERDHWNPEDFDGDFERVINGYVEWLGNKLKEMFSEVGTTAIISRVIHLGSFSKLKERDLGSHWTIPVENIYNDYFLSSIDIDNGDEGELYVLLGELAPTDILFHIEDLFIYNEENEVTISFHQKKPFKWLVVCKYGDVNVHDPKNSKILKQLI